MSDLISRQAATDALDEIEAEVADGFGFEYEKWRKYFCDLPPAQPERIVRCKDCRYYNSEEKECLDLMGHGRRWEEDDFCSYGAKMEVTE